jgi:DNA-binding MarR family transcriptional regulator
MQSIELKSAESQDSLAEMQFALRRVMKSLVFADGPPSALAELPVSQLRCWYFIAENEGLKMQDVSNALHMKLPAMSQIVERLVRRGLVDRQADPLDRRVARLHLTECARTIHLESKALHRARIAATSARIAPKIFEQIIKGLNLLAEAAEGLEKCAQAECAGHDSQEMTELIAKRGGPVPRIKPASLSPTTVKRGQTHGKQIAVPVVPGVRGAA